MDWTNGCDTFIIFFFGGGGGEAKHILEQARERNSKEKLKENIFEKDYEEGIAFTGAKLKWKLRRKNSIRLLNE